MTEHNQSVGDALDSSEDFNHEYIDSYDDRTCPICKFKNEMPLQIHYGSKACFSCRAFFRRAHQKTKSPNFICKRNNTCEITVKTRRRCQKCRYTLCLKSGMLICKIHKKLL